MHQRSSPIAHQAQVESIVRGDCSDPFAILGPHGGDPPTVCTFQPQAQHASVIDRVSGVLLRELPRLHSAGFFGGAVPGLNGPQSYRLRLREGADEREIYDPYGFPPILGDLDAFLIGEGRHWRLFEKLGAHPDEYGGISGVRFAVWAPNALRASVVGDFNSWDGRRHPMRKRIECGVWELFIPGIRLGSIYKFELLDSQGRLLPLKSDPFAFRAEHPPRTASVVHGLTRFAWHDQAWMARRGDHQSRHAPISIYECHLGSWMRIPEEGERFLSYGELAERLVPYVEDMGFTHLELMPISEHPFDGSWGYQPIGLYAPTIRHGTPDEFAALVERCHSRGIGVIADWVPGHFPSDPHGLARFDGTALYEHEDPRKGFHRDWHTLIFNYGRNEVTNYLTANALFWLNHFHLDGLRVDAVASMLYLDYSREPGDWMPNVFGGRENLEAVAFLRRTNEEVFGQHPGATTVAEESTAWPGVSRPTYHGGLGFGFKWNMGWMHDTLRYMSRDAIHRKFHHDDLTFGLLYAFSENFILPLSHDEVVHGKGSLLGRMPGDQWQRFANLRAYFVFMWAHPGKKLLFMGGEFAQTREWDHGASLDWHLLDSPMHRGVQHLVRDLNRLYRSTPALYELDCEGAGFEWIDAGDAASSVLSFLRRGFDPGRFCIAVCNFTPIVRENYRIGVPAAGDYRQRINSDDRSYGGSGVSAGAVVRADGIPWHGRPMSIRLTLPPLATVIYEYAPS
jgi:1,4-alpha-glucan branching enzyme